MADEPPRFSNWDEASLTPTERRDLILATLELARGYMDLYGRWPTVQDVEEHLTGKRSL